jgi:hypothetical protein
LFPALQLQQTGETQTADAHGGRRLQPEYRPPIHNRQVHQPQIPHRHRFRPLRNPPQTSPATQDTRQLRPPRGLTPSNAI